MDSSTHGIKAGTCNTVDRMRYGCSEEHETDRPCTSDCAWVLTHLDDADIQESWSFPAKKEDVFTYLKQARFPDVWNHVVSLTPEDRIVDYVSSRVQDALT